MSVVPLIISSGSTLLLKNPSQTKMEEYVKKVEQLDDVYKVKNIAVWEVEKGKQV